MIFFVCQHSEYHLIMCIGKKILATLKLKIGKRMQFYVPKKEKA